MGYGVVTSGGWDVGLVTGWIWWLWRGERVMTYMPELPPVTMNTLPERSGRLSGWKVMVKDV